MRLKEMAYLRCFFTFVLLLSGIVCSYSQSRFQLGFKTGANFSFLTNTVPEMNESFSSFESGPFVGDFFSYKFDANFFSDAAIRFSMYADVGYKLTDNLNAQLGIGYAGRGMDLHDEGSVYTSQINGTSETILYGNFSYNRKVKTNYLSVPITLKYYVGLKHRFFVTAGTYFDFLLSSKVYGDQNYTRAMDVVTDGVVQTSILAMGESHFDDQDAHTAKLDFGLTYGAGVEFPIDSRVNFIFTMNMNHGLLQIDGKYENETRVLPVTSGFVVVHNNYYGLNSNAKNLTLTANIGITYQL